MTPLKKVFDAFMVIQLEDEWANWTLEEINMDLKGLLLAALPNFKFPRVSLEIIGENFEGELTNREVQILASYMKCEWLNRSILTWEHIKPQYEEKDFSEANLLDKLYASLEHEQKHAERLESKYYRSIDNKPYKYRNMAGEV